MGRHALPDETKNKIRELAATGMGQRPIARELGLSRISVENILFPKRLKQRRVKKQWAKIIKMDLQELPYGCFNVNERENWAI